MSSHQSVRSRAAIVAVAAVTLLAVLPTGPALAYDGDSQPSGGLLGFLAGLFGDDTATSQTVTTPSDADGPIARVDIGRPRRGGRSGSPWDHTDKPCTPPSGSALTLPTPTPAPTTGTPYGGTTWYEDPCVYYADQPDGVGNG